MAITRKAEIVELMAEITGGTKVSEQTSLDALIEVIHNTLEDKEEFTLPTVGKFKVADRAARVGHNPQNPEEKIDIPAHQAPTFTLFPKFRRMYRD